MARMPVSSLLQHTQGGAEPERSCPPPIARIIARALAKNPDHRFPSCMDLVRALQGEVRRWRASTAAQTGANLRIPPSRWPRPSTIAWPPTRNRIAPGRRCFRRMFWAVSSFQESAGQLAASRILEGPGTRRSKTRGEARLWPGQPEAQAEGERPLSSSPCITLLWFPTMSCFSRRAGWSCSPTW